MTEIAPARGFAAYKAFPFNFWLINTIELFERGAYYSMAAVLSVYLSRQGMPAGDVGTLLAVLLALLYFIPPIAAAPAEKYGFRLSLLVAFVLLAGGYATLALGSTPLFLWTGVVLIGVGAGIFKPIAAAAVAQASTPEQRNLGFTIYYMCINIGSFVFPLAVAIFFVAKQMYWAVFTLSAALIALNFVVTLVLYKNVVPPQKEKNVGAALKESAVVLKDGVFLVLVLFYAGLWFMYAQFQYYAPVYMQEFSVVPASFNEAFFATINPAVIILLGPLLGKLVEKRPSLPVVIVGMSLYAFGTAVYGLFGTMSLFLAGAVIVSIGEVLAHPNYLSYVSKIAPKDRVATYLGYGFLSVGLGYVFGAKIGGELYAHFAQTQGRPAFFWGIVAAVGLVSVALLILYNRAIEKKRGATTAPASPGVLGYLTKPAAALAALLLVPAVIGAGVMGGTDTYTPLTGAAESTSGAGAEGVELATLEGTTAEGQSSERTVDVGRAYANLAFVLTWSDEPSSSGVTANAPDTLKLTVKSPMGKTFEKEAANPTGGEGHAEVLLENAEAGAYVVTVTAVRCGDEQVTTVALPVGPAADTGNAWKLVAAAQ